MRRSGVRFPEAALSVEVLFPEGWNPSAESHSRYCPVSRVSDRSGSFAEASKMWLSIT